MSSGAAVPAPHGRDKLLERYEDLRASVLGLRVAPRWGLTVALRQGLVRWMRAVGETDVVGIVPETSDGSPQPSVDAWLTATMPLMRDDIIPIVAQMVVQQLKRGHPA
jgi:hypothetical protein